jgi:hypothetical protein
MLEIRKIKKEQEAAESTKSAKASLFCGVSCPGGSRENPWPCYQQNFR